jgi:hypothetical protein
MFAQLGPCLLLRNAPALIAVELSVNQFARVVTIALPIHKSVTARTNI